MTVRVDDALVGEIVRRLVEAVDPDRIALFGSQCYHTCDPGGLRI